MRIVLVNHYAGSPRHGMEFRPYFLARAWQAAGHHPIVVAGSHSHLRNENPTVTSARRPESVDGIDYRWLRTPAYRGNGLGRIRNILTFLLRLRSELGRIAREGPIDAIIASSTYPLDYGPCERVAQRTGAALLFEVHDLWPLSPMELGGYSARHPFIRILQRAEDRFCRTADRVVSILPRTLEHLAGRGLDPRRFRFIPNGVDGGADLPGPEAIPAELGAWIAAERAAGRFIIGYAGGISDAYAIPTLLDAAATLAERGVSVLLLGSGRSLEEYERLVRERGLRHVRFAGRFPRDAALATLASLDAIWVGLRAEPLFRFGIGMNKIFDAMLTGRPVLGSYTAGNDPIGEAGCGLRVPAEDAAALTDAIERLRAMPADERDELGRRGQRFVRSEHDYAVIAERFIDAIREAKSDPNPARGVRR
jgi:glycosyltransferase involved in cell wall biosynthesis